VAEQLQVSRETVGLGFLRKPQLCAGVTVHKTSPVRNTFGTDRINFFEKDEEPEHMRSSGIYNPVSGI
jgi:hypothetical protein